MKTNNKQYEMEVLVTSDHIDGLNHVNNVQYLYWVQEVAKAHWNALTASLSEIEGVWVVRNHFIEYKKPAFLGEQLHISTRVKTMRGPLSERYVAIRNASTGELLVQCTTSWCYIELSSRKLITVPKRLQELLLKGTIN
ncbi:MAG: acyl-CoA thioesterase [Flavobacteriaceae bacterium]